MELNINTKRLKLTACSEPLLPLMKLEHYDHYPHILSHVELLKKDHTFFGWGPWLILDMNQLHIVGDIGFKGKPDSDHTVEIGYGILPSEQSKGYATEALQGLIDWAFERKNVKRITAVCRHDNDASIRVLNKVNMVPVRKELQMISWERKAQ
ncbi:GNAT family N-acetyltransferase [Salipaludibacillus daqingensis]|uniref:GNAT family N-acetyltransferase n=1 Tax=Salipaludibacillus daqingensis TaxID=3041001 RepID=UPI0024730CF4|nr:GNAT family N-acetyltransferase [Salipaludibacillus daqingensis]